VRVFTEGETRCLRSIEGEVGQRLDVDDGEGKLELGQRELFICVVGELRARQKSLGWTVAREGKWNQ